MKNILVVLALLSLGSIVEAKTAGKVVSPGIAKKMVDKTLKDSATPKSQNAVSKNVVQSVQKLVRTSAGKSAEKIYLETVKPGGVTTTLFKNGTVEQAVAEAKNRGIVMQKTIGGVIAMVDSFSVAEQNNAKNWLKNFNKQADDPAKTEEIKENCRI